MKGDSDHGVELLRRASLGDRQAFADLFTLHRPGLHDMIRLRLDDRLKARIDPSDVLQETFLEADRRLKEYVSHPKMPFLLWLRFIARQKILALHRHHLGVLARDPRREIRLDAGSCTGTNSVAIADGLLGRLAGASTVLLRSEIRSILEKALGEMEALDREVLTLRHIEELTNAEVAEELGITQAAACRRYIRALEKIKRILDRTPWALEEP